MTQHPALAPGNVAVITGGADGIGYSAARYYQSQGMRVCIADINEERLSQAAAELGDVLWVVVDVSERSSVERLKSRVWDVYGRVDVLMNNAGLGVHCGSWGNYEAWQTTINTNLWGVINGIQCFVPDMVAQGSPELVVNTGSKQGITSPPGNPAYNVSKAAIKSVTETLQHDLRNTPDCMVSAHLLVPGFTYTGLVRQFLAEKPDGAWTPDQVIEYMAEALVRGDFYIICPDNDVTREMDAKRMEWAMGDLVENRPPMSRWHPDYQASFEAFAADD